MSAHIKGAGGGGGGGTPRKPVETKDSLHSVAYFRIMDLVSEGEIAGLANGKRSIFLNETPLVNDDGTENFERTHVEQREGTQAQTHIPGFDAVENEISVGVELDAPASATWIKTLNDPELSAVRITLGWPALSKADTGTGDIRGYTIKYRVELSTNGSAFEVVLDTKITGKTTSKYQRSHRVDLPPIVSGYWQVRVVRTTDNAHSSAIADVMTVDSYTELVDAKLRYPNSAMVAVMGDAKQFGSIPRRSYDLFGRIIRVPANYAPDTRTYAGIWDGTFKLAYTNNPAWVFYDLATHPRYGLGDRIDPSLIDKWALYEIGRYCDQSVADGTGGTEPRMTCTVYLQTQQDAFKLLSDLATVFRGISYWAGGAIVAHADMPSDPTYIYNPANVIDGVFNYAGSPRRTRFNAALVTWNDPANFYRSTVEYVEDRAGIERYGYQPTEVTAIGCTSQGQAQRVGNWILRTSRMETDTVTFGVGLDGTLAAPGQVILIADPLRMQKRRGGRVHDARITYWGPTQELSITLDAVVDDFTGSAVLHVMDTAGQMHSASVKRFTTEAGRVVAKVNMTGLTDPITGNVLVNVGAQWVITSNTDEASAYRVLSVTEDKSGEQLGFTIAAVAHATAKYGAIDDDTNVGEGPTEPTFPATQLPPTGVVITEDTSIAQGTAHTTVGIAWIAPSDGNAVSYKVAWRRDEGNWTELPPTANTSAFIEDAKLGMWQAQVIAVSAAGLESSAAISAATPVTGKTDNAIVPVLTATSRLFAIDIDWTIPAGAEDMAYTEIRYKAGIGTAPFEDPGTWTDVLGQYAAPTSHGQLNALQPGAGFSFAGRFVDTSDNPGPWSAIVAAAALNPFADVEALVDQAQADATEARNQLLLLGEPTAANDAFVLDQSTTKIDPSTTLASYIQGVYADLGDKANASALTALDARVTDTEGDISANSTALTAVRTDLGAVPPGYGSFSQAVDWLFTETNTHGDDISTNTAAITAIRTSVDPQFDAVKTWDFGAAGSALGWAVLSGSMTQLAQTATDRGALRITPSGQAYIYINAGTSGPRGIDSMYVCVRAPSGAATLRPQSCLQRGSGGYAAAVPDYTTIPADGEWHVVHYAIADSGLIAGTDYVSMPRFDATTSATLDVLWIGFGLASRPAAYAEADTVLQAGITANGNEITATSQAVTQVKASLAGTGKPSSYYATATSALYAAVTKGGTGDPDDFINAAAMWTVTLDVNGYATGITYANDGSTAAWKMDADSFAIKSKNGTYQLEWEQGVITTKSGSTYTRVGAGFGASGNLVFYSGGATTAAASNISNAKVAIDTAGRTKFAGALTSAGGAFSGNVVASVNGTSATISVGSGTFRWGDTYTSYSASSTTVSGSQGQTRTYYLYYLDPGMTGGSKTLYASTSATAFAGSGTVSVGVVTVRFASPGNPGGSSGGGSCVTVDTRLPTGRAGAVTVGDLLDVADPVTLRGRQGRVSYSQPATMPCVRLTTGRGVTLQCSESAPIPDSTGKLHPSVTMLDREVWSQIGGTWLRDRVTSVEHIGYRQVQHITCENACFLAGDGAGYILHHNLKPVPPVTP